MLQKFHENSPLKSIFKSLHQKKIPSQFFYQPQKSFRNNQPKA